MYNRGILRQEASDGPMLDVRLEGYKLRKPYTVEHRRWDLEWDDDLEVGDVDDES